MSVPVYVLNMRGEPLMPCGQHKARRLLRDKKAKIVNYDPFTIQLKIATGETKQDITLGVDAGSKTVGISASTEKKELYASETQLRNDIVDLIATKAQFRRARRNRKTRYRQARFLNRKKNKGWLAPSIRHKISSHLKLVASVHKILPITKVVVETAAFDTQLLKNPDISGDAYQKGDQLGFWNTREYVLFRDNHQCQHCKGKSKDRILNVHHIESRKIGGDAPNNLVTLCETCHDKHHSGKIDLKVKRGAGFKDAAFMGIMRWSFYECLKTLYDNVSMTFGFVTKNTRIRNDISKSHVNDAFCIANNINAERADVFYVQKYVRKQIRQLHKANTLKGGARKSNKAERIVKGFRLFDQVVYNNVKCFVFGRRLTGYFDIRKLDGTKVHASAGVSHLSLVKESSTLLSEVCYT